jgi:hypothetical protein
MRKFFILVFFIALYISDSKAQEIIIDSVSSHCFGGVQSGRHGSSNYTYYITGHDDNKAKTAKLHIHILGREAHPQNTVALDVSKSTIVLASAMADHGLLFVLGDPVAKTRTIMALERNGEIKATKKEENVSPASFTNTLRIFPGMPDGLILFAGGGKNGSYAITRYNHSFEEEWKKEYAPKNGTMEIITTASFMDKLTVLEKIKPDAKKERYQYHLRTIMSMHGDEIAYNALEDSGDYMYPSTLGDMMGISFIGGAYYKNGDFDEKAPSGLLLGQLEPHGRLFRTFKLPFSSLQKFLPDTKVKDLQNGTQIIVQAIVPGGRAEFSIICELLTRQYNNVGAEVTISDPFIIYANGEGEVKGINFVPKVTPAKITIKGKLAKANIHTVAGWLMKNDAFAYRFTTRGRESRVCFTHVDNEHRRKTLLYAIDSPATTPAIGLPFDREASKANTDKWEVDTDAPPAALYPWLFQNAIISGPDKMIRYDMAPPKLTIGIFPLPK